MNAFWHWWQHLPHHIDPVIFQIGSFRLQYYGLMYLAAFGTTYLIARYRLKREEGWTVSVEHLQGVMTAMIIGLIVGARLGYVLFYNLSYYAAHPLEIILPFQFQGGIRFTGISGMSYHGGLAGTLLGLFWYTRKYRLRASNVLDLLAPCGAAGYTFGRIGNFLNGELWGRITTAPIGMYFPDAEGDALRHPSQLYEAFGEGLLLFLVLWFLRHRIRTPGVLFSCYLIGYGLIRFVIEFFRAPDAHMGFIFFSFSMGQLLCGAMIILGLMLMLLFSRATGNSRGKRRPG